MKKTYFSLIALFLAFGLFAQNQVVVQVSASGDDAEEKADVTGQAATVGAMDVTSSDLELGSEDGDGSTPQLVGIRFQNITIPKGAFITNAYIQFGVDETKNTEAGVYAIQVQSDANPAAFNDTPFNISTRPTFFTSIAWDVPANTWLTAGEAGDDQKTPNLSALVQLAIDQEGWASGNAIAFIITGTGTKVAEAFDGDASLAPKLTIEYSMVETITSRVSAGEDDIEEYIAGAQQTKTVGSFDVGSSDLELGSESGSGADPQLVGIRFSSVNIAPDAKVVGAYIQFTVDELKNEGAGSYVIKAQMDPNPAAFNTAIPASVSSRSTFETTVSWNVPAGTWLTAGEAGTDQRTADISSLINAIIGQSGWASGNAMVFTITGTGTKVAESYDGDPSAAPQLVILAEKPADENIVTVLEGCEDTTPAFDEEEFELDVLGTFRTNVFDEGAAEIVAFDKSSKRLFFVNANKNSVSILDISNPANPTLITEVDMSAFGGGVNSVAAFNGLVAAAVEGNDPVLDNGKVVFLDPLGNILGNVEVGVLPDMVTFTPDGTKVLTANEGQPSDDYTVDPEGSVSVINVSGGVASATVTNINFQSFNSQKVSLQNKGVRIFGPNATVAQDLEPEYIAVSDDNTLAYVSLQENNALAVINLTNNAILDILPQGYKDYNSGRPVLNQFVLNELIDLPILGTPPYPNNDGPIYLGGFSGLYYDATESTATNYVFYTIPDRGPNEEPVAVATATPAPLRDLRPYKLPEFQNRIVKISINFENYGKQRYV